MALTQISTEGIKNGTITNADLASNAAIDGSKINTATFNQSIVTSSTQVRVNKSGSTDVDGFMGEAYSNYFGLKHTDQTFNSEYMILSQDTHTYISASTGSNVYIRAGGNSSDYQLIVGAGNSALTWRGFKVWHENNDGAGSGLDADTLDGISSGQFVRSDAEDTITTPLNINGGTANGANDATLFVTATNNNDWGLIVNKNNSGSTEYGVDIRVGSSANYGLRVVGGSSDVFRVTGSGNVYVGGSNTVWHAGNDGSGSGLDADTLDGVQGSSYLRSDANDTTTGNLTISKTAPLLTLKDTNASATEHPTINFDTNNNQGVALVHNEFDSDLPIAGYGLILQKSASNTQTSSATLSFNVLGNIYAGATSLGSLSRVLTTADEGSGNGLDSDTVDGIQASSFLRSDANDSASGQLTLSNKVIIDHNNDPLLEIKPVNSGPWAISINRDDLSSSKVFAHNPGSQGVGWVFEHCPYVLIDSNYRKVAITSTNNVIGYSPNFPAGSAENIKDAVSGTPDNGWYWIQQFGNVARLHYCAFKDKNGNDIAGGPWTMNWVAGVHPNQFSSNGSTALGQYLNLCKGIGIDKPGRGMESSRTTSQVYGAWLAVKRALWDLDPGFFNGASSGSGGVLTMPLMNINGEGGSSAHRLVYSTGTSTHIPPNQDGDHCNQNQLFCGWWGGNDFSSWATDNNSVPSPEDWGPGDAPHTGNIGAKSNSTQQKPSWKDMMLITCIYK